MSGSTYNAIVDCERAKLKGSMGVKSIVGMVIATAAPLTIMVANTPLIISVGNGPAAPLDCFIAMVIMLLFSVGFVAMSRHINDAGAFYACIQKGLGRILGLGSATLMMTCYTLFLMGLATYIGVTLSDLVSGLIGKAIPWWCYSFVILWLIGILGYRRIELSSRFLGVALALEIGAVVIIDVLVVHDKGMGVISLSAFGVPYFMTGSPGLGILLAIYAFIGFESTIIYREEAKNPAKTIPIATYVAVISLGVFYVISTWCVVAGIGVDKVLAMATEHPADMYLVVAGQFGGAIFSDIVQALVITSIFACMLSLHNIVVRYVYTLGKYKIISPRFSDVHTHHGSPYFSSLALSLVSTLIIIIFAASGLDPITQIYVWGATLGTLGYMIVVALASFAILVFFRRNSVDKRVWHTLIAPLLGFVGVVSCIWVAFSNLPMLVGGNNGAEVVPLISVSLLIFFAVGITAALRLKRNAPERYNSLLDFT